ncbi:hypothetical protein IJ596_01050 [bacterium]|nr:hypothetical protein [bacterium]
MKKLLQALFMCLLTCCPALSVEVPKDIQDFVNESFPQTDFRFDGAVILPDNTMYLPVFPSKEEDVSNIEIKSTYPKGQTLKQKPDMVIFNNRFSLLKVINTNGKKTVLNMVNPPDELQSGLLPQDIMLPKGLVFPESLKGIIGDIDVGMTEETGLRITNPKNRKDGNTVPVDQLKNKNFYIASGIGRNIQVVESDSKIADFALEQDNIINDMKGYNGKFMLVTYFGSSIMNVISLMDEKVIKKVNFETNPEQILIDSDNKVAYISSGSDSSIYVFSLETMTLKRKLKINGLCEKLSLSADGTKIFYVDRNKNDIWAIELDNNYKLKNIGMFPNISEIAYVNGKIYVISRTQNRLAIVDYETLELVKELEVCEKPIDLYVQGNELYILGAQDNIMEVLDTNDDVITDKLYLNTNSFATNITPIEGTSMIMVTNARPGMYSVVDTEYKDIIKTSPLNVPVRSIVVLDKVKTIK